MKSLFIKYFQNTAASLNNAQREMLHSNKIITFISEMYINVKTPQNNVHGRWKHKLPHRSIIFIIEFYPEENNTK